MPIENRPSSIIEQQGAFNVLVARQRSIIAAYQSAVDVFDQSLSQLDDFRERFGDPKLQSLIDDFTLKQSVNLADTLLQSAIKHAANSTGADANLLTRAVFGIKKQEDEQEQEPHHLIKPRQPDEDFTAFTSRARVEVHQAAVRGIRAVAEAKGWSPHYLLAMAGWSEPEEDNL